MTISTDSPTLKLLNEKRAPIRLSELPKQALAEVQAFLCAAGITVTVDGAYGPDTEAAWLKFLSSSHQRLSDEIGWGSFALLHKQAIPDDNKAASEASVPALTMPGLSRASLGQPIVPGCGITWGEMTRNGERISISREVTDNMVAFAKAFRPLREVIGTPIIITSAYRPPAVNRAVGGSTASWHLFDRHGQGAIDFYVPGEDVMDLFGRLNPHWNGGLAFSRSGGFVHVDNGPERTWAY